MNLFIDNFTFLYRTYKYEYRNNMKLPRKGEVEWLWTMALNGAT